MIIEVVNGKVVNVFTSAVVLVAELVGIINSRISDDNVERICKQFNATVVRYDNGSF